MMLKGKGAAWIEADDKDAVENVALLTCDDCGRSIGWSVDADDTGRAVGDFDTYQMVWSSWNATLRAWEFTDRYCEDCAIPETF
jgi:hypothetical protein